MSMSGKTVAVGLRIEGDASGARKAATETAADLKALADDAAKVRLLDAAVTSVERFEAAVQATQAKVRALRETLSEAYAAGADAPMIRKLEKDLAAVERQARQSEGALQKAEATVIDLNLRFADAGISAANLADKKAELIQRSQDVAQAAQEEAKYQRFLADETERAAKAAAQLAADASFEAQRQQAMEAQKAAQYTGWWAEQLDRAAQAKEDLDAALDLDKQRQANVQTQKAAEYADWWAKELEQVDRAAQTARASTTTLNRSFAALNIRSADQINAEILEINQALLDLAKRADLTGDEFDRAFAQGQRRLAALKQEAAGGGAAMDDVGRRAGNLSAMFGRLGRAFIGFELAKELVRVNAELENVERTFNAVTASAEDSAREMDYAREVAARLGLEQIATARSYASLMAATKGTAAEGEKTRQVFESVARAMSLAGKSSADTEGALLALQQMASKGVVSMEELRGQLGERLPGALNAVAQGLGITTAQLIKLVETGQLTAEELFPALSDGLNKLYKDASTETLTQEWQHFKTSIENVYKTIGDAGPIAALKLALEGMETTVVTVDTMITALGKDIGVFFGALANGDIGLKGFSENAKQAFAEVEEEARQRLLLVAQHNGVMAASLDEVGQQMLAQAKEREASVDAEARKFVSLKLAHAEVAEAAATATAQSVKNAEAIKAQGEASIKAAEAMGGEADQLRARAQAATADAAALADVAQRRQAEAAAMAEQVSRMRELTVAAGGATEQQQKVIDNLVKLAEARQADADKATAQATQSQMAAVRAEVEAKAYESARGELSKWSATKEAQLSVDQAAIRLAIEQQRTIAAVAKERGNEYEATQALLEIKKLEIKLAELTAKAKAAEADAIMASVKAERAALEMAGKLTEAKKAELVAAEASANVKKVEADIAAETANRLRQLADAQEYNANTARWAADANDKLANSLDGVASAARDAEEAQKKLDAARKGETRASAPVFDPRRAVLAAGVEQADLDDVTRRLEYLIERQQAQGTGRKIVSQRGIIEPDYSGLIRQAMADVYAGQADVNNRGAAAKKTETVEPVVQQNTSPSSTTAALSIRRVQIDLRGSGGTTRLYADDEASADSFIRMLERDARRSS
jgi:tape measure domain-containing protein